MRLNTTLYCQKMDMTTTRPSKRKSSGSYAYPGAASQHKKEKIPKELKVEARAGICTMGYDSDELLHLYLL